MKILLNKWIAVLICCLLLLPLIPRVAADEVADNITSGTVISSTSYDSTAFLTDGNIKTYKTGKAGTITLENDTGMAGIYILFDLEYGSYTVTDNESGNSFTAGSHGFLHEFLDLEEAFGKCPTSVTLEFSNGKPRISEISVYSSGATPENVQRWDAPHDGGADIVLFAAHGDDDQLFFAGLLPYYAGQLDCRVQVVYLTDHRNDTNSRTHEMLNGLWAVGVDAYPVFGSFADFRIDDLQGSYDYYKSAYGTSQDDLLSFVVEQIRRFKPLVAVGHDLNGEYGHGMHMVYADLLTKAIQISGDETQFTKSATEYGVWQVQKMYLHLYEENAIVLDYDQPLDQFGGMTAFEVTQKLGYPCHESQQWTWFTGWINGKNDPITLASQIKKYNPCKFGLYYSSVGEDVQKNDFLENIITYAEQERLEQERLEQERLEQERLEQERLEQERLEQERLEQERLEQERLEQERLEQERLEQERLEQERLEQERLEQEKLEQEQKKKRNTSILLAGMAILVAIGGFLGVQKKK